MNLQVIYCNHQSANLGLREQLAFPSQEQLHRAYEKLQSIFPQSETVVISTCNRVEIYTAQEAEQDAPSQQQMAQFFSEFHNIPVENFFDDLLSQTGPDVVRHLFQVVSSLDSMVLGEPQIVSQVKEAYQLSEQNDACGPLTNALFQGALRVSARVRTETKLSEGRVSIASVAVGDFGKRIFDRFDDKTILIIGAGEMAEETLRYLKDEGAKNILVTNRHFDKAEQLAATWGGIAKPWDDLDFQMSLADVIVSTTGAEQPIVTVERFRKVRLQSRGKPVFILDLGAPRDFEPRVRKLDDSVFLFDIDSLQETCNQNRAARHSEIEKANSIIEDETSAFMSDFYYRATGPIIKRLREEWHDIRQTEVDRLFSRMKHLEEKDRKEIEKSVERIVNKLLHPPLTALRDEAKEGSPHGLMNALKQLFGLKD
ncbi:Glutamyl-tRNA reductase [hydrothermal vent metagenome]|uniref:glutamyl-tRNA reductase n=1 Tax=hydrothermal vent metagenome TaxID=652676 RepID=A0A3B1DRC6_9ZZZZ